MRRALVRIIRTWPRPQQPCFIVAGHESIGGGGAADAPGVGDIIQVHADNGTRPSSSSTIFGNYYVLLREMSFADEEVGQQLLELVKGAGLDDQSARKLLAELFKSEC